MPKYLTINQRKANIRKMPTAELKTYASAYRKGMIYKFAYETAMRELKRRKMKSRR